MLSPCHGQAGLGWAWCHMGLWPLSTGQGLAATPALDLISIFITAALGGNEEVSYICVHVHISIVSHDPTVTFCCCSTQVKLHFLIGKLSSRVCKGLCRDVITACSPVKVERKFGCCFEHIFCCFCAMLNLDSILNKTKFREKAASFHGIKWILNAALS